MDGAMRIRWGVVRVGILLATRPMKPKLLVRAL